MAKPLNGTLDGRARVDRSRLSPPKRQRRICDRRELLQNLVEVQDSKLTLMVAPAGYGKTTIIAQWYERLVERQVTVAYYSASNRDREPAAFLFMLASALDMAGVDMSGSSALDGRDGLPGPMLEHILLRIELAGVTLVLFIDDFERVESPEINALIRAILDASPASMHLVLGSRCRPHIRLAALEMQGHVRQFDASHLRLSRHELSYLLDLAPDSQRAADVAARTEGWPVAVQMYRLWLERHSSDPDPRFGGHVAEVADYLTEQLFSSLTDEQRSLLIDIAKFEDVEPSFVDCLRRRSDSGCLLEETALTLSALVRRLDGAEDITYRIHPLLAEYLHAYLVKEPKRVAWLSANAAVWYVQHHRCADAVRSALDGHDDEVMMGVLRGLRPIHLLLNYGVAMLRAILREIPESFIAKHPRLQLLAVLAHYKAGFFFEARAMLERIRERTNDFSNDPDGESEWLIAEGNLIDLVLLTQVGRPSPRVETLYRTIVSASRDDPTLWGACENVMIVVSQERGDLEAAKASVIKTRRLYNSVGLMRYGNLQLIGQELLVTLAGSNLRKVAELIAGYQKQSNLECEDDTSIPSMLRLVLAAIRYEREFDDQSVDMLQKALAEYGASESRFDQYAIAYPCILMRLFIREGTDAVFDFLAKARSHAHTVGIESLPLFLEILEVEYRVRSGDISHARRVAERCSLQRWVDSTENAQFLTWRERDSAAGALALLCLAERDCNGASRIAKQLVTNGQRGGRLRTQIKGLILNTLAIAARDDDMKAIGDLLEAVVLAYPQGFVAPFAEEGEIMGHLLGQLEPHVTTDAFARRHIKILRGVISNGMQRTKMAELNDREREIVAYLAAGASNKLIGKRMGITDNTVKFHLKKIFSKLDVSTRRAAVAKLGVEVGVIEHSV